MIFSMKSLARQINSLKERERKLILVTGLVTMIGLFTLMVWKPLLDTGSGHFKVLAEYQSRIATINTQAEMLKAQANEDLNQPIREKITELKLILERQENDISSITSALVNPELMTNVFGRLLSSSQLQVEKMNNSPATPVEISAKTEDVTLLYQHDLFLGMTGRYEAVMKYVSDIEQQDWKLYWDELEFVTRNYPTGSLTLKVHTLSTSEYVLGI